MVGKIFMFLLMSFCHLSTIAVSSLKRGECLNCTHQTTVKVRTITNIVSKKFLSVGLDAAVLCDKESWEGFNISSPRLLALSRAFSPSYLRFGGTSQDYVIFSNAAVEPKESVTQEKVEGFHCPNNTLLMVKDWLKLNEYVNKVGWDLIFGLNALLRNGTDWNPDNAIELINFNAKLGYHVGWELGNELNMHHQMVGEQLGKDFVKLRKILNSVHHNRHVLLVGPDVTRRKFQEFLVGFLHEAKGVIDAITFHHYYFDGKTATLEDFLNVDNFELFEKKVKQFFKAVKEANATQKVWLGETSTAWGGGAPGLSDRYVAGFLWLDKLGLSAVNGIHVVMKQSIYRGNYALLTKELYPTPNYWLSILYKRLVGRRALKCSIFPPDKTVRIYASCVRRESIYNSSNGLTFYAINLKNITSSISLRTWPHSDLHQYLLTPAGKMGLKSMNVSLNGHELKMNGTNLPDFVPKVLPPGSLIVLPPHSFGFFVLPNAKYPGCYEEENNSSYN